MFGAASRMLIGAVLATMAAALLDAGLRWHKAAIKVYVIGGSGFFAGMLSVYWAAQYIPTGWISLIYGLMPLVTALFASRMLEGEAINGHRLLGMVIGIAGLAVVFATAFSFSGGTALGIIGVLAAVLIHAGGSVWIKRIDAGIPAIAMTSGGLLFAAPCYLLFWLVADGGVWPEHASMRTIASIGYLSLFGSVFGFALYFYVLKHVEATKTALITLIAPVAALTLGNLLNGEQVTPEILSGAVLILAGLALFEFGHRLPAFAARGGN